MSWITELINAIPDIVIYIAPGFLLVTGFIWVTHRKFSTPQIQIVASIVASFVVKSCFDGVTDVIGVQLSAPLEAILLCVISGLFGILIGIAIGAEWFTNVLIFFHIYRSGNHSIWDDVLHGNMWMSVYDDKQNLYYCGQVRHTSDDDKQLLVALAEYYVMDNDKKVVEWHLEADDYIMIDTSHYHSIRVSKTDPFNQTEPA